MGAHLSGKSVAGIPSLGAAVSVWRRERTADQFRAGSSSIFAPQTMGGLVQLAVGNLAMHLPLGSASRSGANSDANQGDYRDFDYFG
jgi:hypothetical protein